MKITQALHELLMEHFVKDMSDELRQLAYSVEPSRNYRYARPPHPVQMRFNALMTLHYHMAKYRREWNQPSKPFMRNSKWVDGSSLRGFYAVLDALTTCKQYLRADGTVAKVLALPVDPGSRWHYDYVAHVWSNRPGVDRLSEYRAKDSFRVKFFLGDVVLQHVRRYPEMGHASETVAMHTLPLACALPGATLGVELDAVSLFMANLKPLYEDACENLETWEKVPGKLKETYEASQRHLKNSILNMPQELRKMVLENPALVSEAVSQARIALK